MMRYVPLIVCALVLVCAGAVRAQSGGAASSSAPATAAATQAALPPELVECINELEKLAKDGKWDEVLERMMPPELRERIKAEPEKAAEVKKRMVEDDMVLRSLAATRTTPAEVTGDQVMFKFEGTGLRGWRFTKIDGKWYVR